MLKSCPKTQLKYFKTAELLPHPENPRFSLREEVVESISNQLSRDGYFSPAHALKVWKHKGNMYILSGHHRREAARRAGVEEIPCWMLKLTEEEAYMQIILSNSQGELSPLEIGVHALKYVQKGKGGKGKNGGLSEYARLIGRTVQYISQLVKAAEVYKMLKPSTRVEGFENKAKHFFEISRVSRKYWESLIAVSQSACVRELQKIINSIKYYEGLSDKYKLALPEEEQIIESIIAGKISSSDIHLTINEITHLESEMSNRGINSDSLIEWLHSNKCILDQTAVRIKKNEILQSFSPLPNGTGVNLNDTTPPSPVTPEIPPDFSQITLPTIDSPECNAPDGTNRVSFAVDFSNYDAKSLQSLTEIYQLIENVRWDQMADSYFLSYIVPLVRTKSKRFAQMISDGGVSSILHQLELEYDTLRCNFVDVSHENRYLKDKVAELEKAHADKNCSLFCNIVKQKERLMLNLWVDGAITTALSNLNMLTQKHIDDDEIVKCVLNSINTVYNHFEWGYHHGLLSQEDTEKLVPLIEFKYKWEGNYARVEQYLKRLSKIKVLFQ